MRVGVQMINISINMPLGVHVILNKLNQNGYEAYIVGGCVRDAILEKVPEDWDITTSALPMEVKKLFPKTYDTGIQHGTITVLIDKEHYEVTTYRIDGIYEDNRRPKEVTFTNNIALDLQRRDFNMNAIAYHPKEGIIDPYDGIGDINNKIIRCVGDPKQRFDEDALRMLRAIRFSAKLNFPIDMLTKNAIYEKSELIKNVSVERICQELTKLLLSDYPEKIIQLKDLNLMEYILPEFEKCIDVEQKHPYHSYTVSEHIIKSVKSVESDLVLRWTMLLHDIGKPNCKTVDELGITHFYGHVEDSMDIAYKVLKRMKFDNNTIRDVTKLVEFHDYNLESDYVSIRQAVNKISDRLFLKLLKVKEADIKAQNPDLMEERISEINTIRKSYFDIKEKQQCVDLKGLKINGFDLKELGINEGKLVGEILKKLLEQVLVDPNLNNKQVLVELAKKYIK